MILQGILIIPGKERIYYSVPMSFDIFFSICQTEIDGKILSEREMFQNFFDQVALAEELNFNTAWVAETHLSCEVQKQSLRPVIPHFKGEIGLNTDILQIAHRVFSHTKNLNLGSAIRNILCNGGPIAHAENIRTFLMLHGLNPEEKRMLRIGFASGRFEFSNTPYGIYPRDKMEEASWPVLKGFIFKEAVEIFLRLLKGEAISSNEIAVAALKREDFRTEEDWSKVQDAFGEKIDSIPIKKRWEFEKLQIIPKEVPLHLLELVIGTHDAKIQKFANTIHPCGTFNLSITPSKKIEESHSIMKEYYHKDGGKWTRDKMPRTVLVFANDDPKYSEEEKNKAATAQAKAAITNYWKAMIGTIDQEKIDSAANNALVGSPEKIIQQVKERFHPEDKLMLWFDFHSHDNEAIKNNMRIFIEKVAPHVRQ